MPLSTHIAKAHQTTLDIFRVPGLLSANEDGRGEGKRKSLQCLMLVGDVYDRDKGGILLV
jgi:hypothetical protein